MPVGGIVFDERRKGSIAVFRSLVINTSGSRERRLRLRQSLSAKKSGTAECVRRTVVGFILLSVPGYNFLTASDRIFLWIRWAMRPNATHRHECSRSQHTRIQSRS